MGSRLRLRLTQREDFAKFYEGQGQLFVPTTEPPAVGSLVTLEVIFHNGPRVVLRGSTQWRRPASSSDVRARPGAGIRAEASESAKIHFLEGYARGGLIDVRERRRLPVRLRVVYVGEKGQRISFTRDVNDEGAFVRTSELLPAGKATLIRLLPPMAIGYPSVSVNAQVIRQQNDGAERGVGVRFVFEDEASRTQFSRFFAKLEEDYLSGNLPESALL